MRRLRRRVNFRSRQALGKANAPHFRWLRGKEYRAIRALLLQEMTAMKSMPRPGRLNLWNQPILRYRLHQKHQIARVHARKHLSQGWPSQSKWAKVG